MQASTIVWVGIRVVLGLVGLASLGMAVALWNIKPKEPKGSYWAAVVGSAIFCLHTDVLDALVWPRLFPVQEHAAA